jgi:hypothetical protein
MATDYEAGFIDALNRAQAQMYCQHDINAIQRLIDATASNAIVNVLAAALRQAVASAQPLPAPLGPPLTEHVDVWPEWVIEARAALAKVSA